MQIIMHNLIKLPKRAAGRDCFNYKRISANQLAEQTHDECSWIYTGYASFIMLNLF